MVTRRLACAVPQGIEETTFDPSAIRAGEKTLDMHRELF